MVLFIRLLSEVTSWTEVDPSGQLGGGEGEVKGVEKNTPVAARLLLPLIQFKVKFRFRGGQDDFVPEFGNETEFFTGEGIMCEDFLQNLEKL